MSRPDLPLLPMLLTLALAAAAATAETLTVEPTDSRVEGLRVEPFRATYDAYRPTEDGGERLVQSFEVSVSETEHEGRAVLETATRTQVGELAVADRARVDRETLAPLWLDIPWQHEGAIVRREVSVDGPRLAGSLLTLDGQLVRSADLVYDRPVFGGLPAGVLLHAIGLEEGLVVRSPGESLAAIDSGTPEAEATLEEHRVRGRETVEISGREREVWVVDHTAGPFTTELWLVDEPPYCLRKTVRSPDGSVMLTWKFRP